MSRTLLPRLPTGADVFAGPPSRPNGTGWHFVVLRVRRQEAGWLATVRLQWEGAAAKQEFVLFQPYEWPGLGGKLGVCFLRGGATGYTVRLYNALRTAGTVSLVLLPTPAWLAAVGVFVQNPAIFWKGFRAISGSLPRRLRRGLAMAAFEGQQMRDSYPDWVALFDAWTDVQLGAIAEALPVRPTVGVLVFCAAEEESLAATLASVQAQFYPACEVVVARHGDAGVPAGEYVAVLQAGEVLSRHALLFLVHDLARHGAADILLADEDRVAADGVRSDPWFKPQPSFLTMCSGVLSRGVWLVRAALLRQVNGQAWAECVRLEAWFALRDAGGADRARRVPHVLTHRRGDAEAAPPAVLAGVVEGELRRFGVQASAVAGFPVRLDWRRDGAAPRVSVIVPSRLRGDVQLRCLLDVLERTAYPDFEMLVVVTQDGPLDAGQQRAAERLAAAGPARVEVLRRGSFNYSAANNFGVTRTDGAVLCLLNDDVSTLEGDWLRRMVAVLSVPCVGIVGAKLYYPNMTTQHGGVIMGRSGLAQHAHRFLPRGEPGYMWRGVLDQEVSVVTGACLLVRRAVFERVGGLDEELPTAFNDVDFCLRVGALGCSVVLAASVELVHHETLSFGHHYADATEQEAADVALMQARWPAVCAADPFHNPNLSLAGQDEWGLAYPPRTFIGEQG